MPTIKITNTLNADITTVPVKPNPITSALEKYVPTPAVNILLLDDLVNALDQPLASAGQNPISLGLKFSDKVDFGTSNDPELTIGANVTQNVNVNAKAGKPLFSTDFYGSPVTVGNGEGWLSLALIGSVNAGLTGSASDLKFGLTASGGIQTEYFRKFAVAADKPSVGEALGSVLSDFILPADVSDLDAMQPCDISTVSGNGSFKISGSASISVSPNPLASPNLPVVNQPVTLSATASLDVAASFEVSGAYEIRVRKLAPKSVELGYYRKKGTQWSASVTASVGVSASVEKTDLLAKLIAQLTSKPEADVTRLLQAGLNNDEIKQIQDAIANSFDNSLKASLDFEFSGSNTDEAAFLYTVDTSALDTASSAAIHAGLDGDLSVLTTLENNDDGHGVIAPGVTMVRSSFKNVRDRKSTLKLNLLGLLNFSSVFELIQKSEVVFEPITGELTINETVSGSSIATLTLPAAQQKLRKIRFNSLLVTTAYRASRSVSSMRLTSSDIYFAFNQNTNEHTMSDYLDGVLGLGLINVGVKQQIMNGFHGTGTSTCLLRSEFDDAACQAMFLDTTGNPRQQVEYERIGRGALQQLLLPGDSNDADKYRRDVLASDPLWEKLKVAADANFRQVLPSLANDTVRLNVVITDFETVMWWAQSMASTAQKLAAVRNFVGSTDPAMLEGNNTFKSLRSDLQKHVASVVSNSQLEFGLPFGLTALFQSAFPQAKPYGLIVSPAFTKAFSPQLAVGA